MHDHAERGKVRRHSTVKRNEKNAPESTSSRRPLKRALTAQADKADAVNGGGHLSGRRFLLLQGPQSGFFRILAKRLRREGAWVEKVCFCGGDVLLWKSLDALWYRGDIYQWPAYFGRLCREKGVTDICLYGDWRPLHWPAVRIARERGIHVWVFEEGYLRTGYSTLEENGVNGRSLLPRNPDEIVRMARGLPEPCPVSYANDIRDKVLKAIEHHFGNVILWPFFRKYRTHRPKNIFFELIGILPRFLTRRARREKSLAMLKAFYKDPRPFFFFPLQLVNDSQIQLYSPYVRVEEALADVLSSFAKSAPLAARLLIRDHPLDNGLVDYRAFISGLANELGIGDRVVYVEDGDTHKMVQKSRGVVLVNSTVGLMAIGEGKPVYCLGHSIYRIPGLAQSFSTNSLESFWTAPKEPNPRLFLDFRKVLAARALVRGNFYSEVGMKAAVFDSVSRFMAVQSPDMTQQQAG